MDSIESLNTKKQNLIDEVNKLTLLKNKLYSKVDIESAMTNKEKDLYKRIADLYSQINQIVLDKRNLTKS